MGNRLVPAPSTLAAASESHVKKPPSSIEEFSVLTTQDLLARAREGSDTAWEVFFRRYRKFLVFAIQMRIPGFAQRRFDAEDVLQSAFLSAWREIQGFEYRGEGSFRSWLRGIVVNNFRNKLRAHDGRETDFDSRILREAEVPDGEDEANDPAVLAAKAEDERRFIARLKELPTDDQEILGMRIFEQLAWTDIGKILGCDRVTARRRCGEAIKRLERGLA